MILGSTRRSAPPVSFRDALLRGLAPDGGLYLPTSWPSVPSDVISSWRGLPIGEIAVRVLTHLVGEEFDRTAFADLVRDAFDFPAPTVPLDDGVSVLELFHGPTPVEQVAEDARQEPRAKILEGERGAVKQLEHRDTIVERDGWRRKVERVAHEIGERRAVELLTDEMGEHSDRDLP